MPTPEEVLICNERTTAEEVILLWRRALDDPGYRRTFCLVHAEKLSYQVGDKVIHSLTELSKGKKGTYCQMLVLLKIIFCLKQIYLFVHSCKEWTPPFSYTWL